jgi:putative transposase
MTNAIENVIGSMRRISARVKRWRNGQMILRWTVAAIADAATRFRRVIGAREGMTQLVRALKDHENAPATGASRRQAVS